MTSSTDYFFSTPCDSQHEPQFGRKQKKKVPYNWTVLSWNTRKFTQESWELRATGDTKGLTLRRSKGLPETTPKTPGMSCHEGRFVTCDTGGSCRSSWSLCTTSVKSSAWKQTTSLVIRGWSLLEKNENSRNFWIQLFPAESFIEPMTYLSVNTMHSLNTSQ